MNHVWHVPRPNAPSASKAARSPGEQFLAPGAQTVNPLLEQILRARVVAHPSAPWMRSSPRTVARVVLTLSPAAQDAQEASETPEQTAREARGNDRQAQRLVAKQAAVVVPTPARGGCCLSARVAARWRSGFRRPRPLCGAPGAAGPHPGAALHSRPISATRLARRPVPDRCTSPKPQRRTRTRQ